MSQIASLLGAERCIEELIPMLVELIDRIDNSAELLMNLAIQLGALNTFLGDNENSVHLLKPLELIVGNDDQIVRDKAIESLQKVAEQIKEQDIYEEYLPLIKRVKKGDVYSMRISACFLYAHIYKRLNTEKRTYVRKKF